ncbi:unnamed protein product [Ilex paraguariensis]|uniref:STICHEL DnaA-N-like alpha-beta domain-containing protein n=1 Tax=Ilex paraguariensis TaxID=185542 RepID=A0ABC8U7T2_9AQUA
MGVLAEGVVMVTESELERLKHALKLLSDAEKQLRVSNERSTWFTATLLQLGSVPSTDPHAGSMTESELERLKHALKLLSDAEKQLRVSNERSTWFTATLLQLGSVPSTDPHAGSSRRQSSKTTEEDQTCTFREDTTQMQKPNAHYAPRKSTPPISWPKPVHQNTTNNEYLHFITDGVSFTAKSTHSTLDDIWVQCIERCHSKTLRLLLHTYGKLVSISEIEGGFVAYIAFRDRDIKTRAERFLSSITNSFEIVLQRNIEARIIFLPDGDTSINSANPAVLPDSLGPKLTETNRPINVERKIICNNAKDNSELDSHPEPLTLSTGSFNDAEAKSAGPSESAAENTKLTGIKDRKPEIPVQRIESIIREQRLETAWLQAVEKGIPATMSNLKPERNQVLPQDGIPYHNQIESMNSMDLSSKNWQDELNHEVKLLKINDARCLQKDQLGQRTNHYPMSPSLLHDSGFVANLSKENMGYESGTGDGGCSGLFCWNNARHNKRGKLQQGTPVHSHKSGRFLWFGECAKPRKMASRSRS